MRSETSRLTCRGRHERARKPGAGARSVHRGWAAGVVMVLAVVTASLLCGATSGLAGVEAQSLALHVRDASTGAGIPSAAVSLISPSKGAGRRVGTTGSSGLVELEMPALSHVEISADGYQSLRVEPVPAGKRGRVTTAWLDPVERPVELRPDSIRERLGHLPAPRPRHRYLQRKAARRRQGASGAGRGGDHH
jgi:hypothetical protein